MERENEGGYTPGPWHYGKAYNSEGGSVPFDYVSPGFYDNPGIIGANGVTVVGCDEYYVFNSPEDARLIAAAPDLLEALSDMVEMATALGPNNWDISDMSDEGAILIAARAAIARALGTDSPSGLLARQQEKG